MTTEALPNAAPFASLRALELRHGELLERLHGLMGESAEAEDEARAVAELEGELLDYLAATLATGAVLDDLGDRTRAQTVYDYWAGVLRRVGREAPRARIAAFDFERLPTLDDDACPYPGLEPFEDAAHFFGREAEVRDLLARVEQQALVLIVGPAGGGKSSLLHAGLLPALRGQEESGEGPPVRVAPLFRPGPEPLTRLAEALAATLGCTLSAKQLRRDPSVVTKLLREHAGPPILVAIDQLEDVLSLVDDAERGAFDQALAALLAAGDRVRLVLVIREELVERLARFESLAERVDRSKNLYRLRPLDHQHLVRAIEQPAANVNLELKPGVVEHLTRELLGLPASLPLLQFALLRLWAQRKRNRIELATAEGLGELHEALDADADARYRAVCAKADESAIQRVLLELVRIDDMLDYHRQVVRLDQLRDTSPDDVDAIVGSLREQGLVCVHDPGSKGAYVELAHEALLRHWERLRAWIKQERRMLRSSRKALADAAQRWDAEGRPSDGLYRRLQVREARKFGGLTQLEQDFLDASDKQIDLEHEQRLRQKNQLVAAFATAAALLLSLTVLLSWMVITERSISDLRLRKGKLETETEALAGKSQELETHTKQLETHTKQLEGEKEKLREEQTQLIEATDDLAQAQNALTGELKRTKLSGFANNVGGELRGKRIHIHLASKVQSEAVTDLMAKLREHRLDVEDRLGRGPAPQMTEVRYYCPNDVAHADYITQLLRKWLDIEATVKRGRGNCSHERAGLVELWLAPDTLTTWIQVATDRNLALAQHTLRKKGLRHWDTPEVMILQRRRYHVTMVGPYPSEEAAKAHIDAAPRGRFDEGKIIRPLDMFCPVRKPMPRARPLLGERLVVCSGLSNSDKKEH